VETVGEFFKKKRESLNITLGEVARVTRIRKTILEAVENGRHDLLPHSVFTRGFLKTYASYLGLDESEVLKRYHEELEKQEVTSDEDKSAGGEFPGRALPTYRIMVLFAVFMAVVVVWFFLPSQREKRTFVLNQEQKKPLIETVELSPVTEPEMPEEKDEEGVLREETEKETETETDTGAAEVSADRSDERGAQEAVTKKMILKVSASEETWIRLQSDQEDPFQMLLKSGESFTAKAHEKFKLRVGNAGGVELFLNEKSLGSPGKKGEVIDLSLPE